MSENRLGLEVAEKWEFIEMSFCERRLPFGRVAHMRSHTNIRKGIIDDDHWQEEGARL